jgi:hypothetical protein
MIKYRSQWLLRSERHRPDFGTLPKLRLSRFKLYVPLWLALTAVIGWIVFRQLRWREKRPKAVSLVE